MPNTAGHSGSHKQLLLICIGALGFSLAHANVPAQTNVAVATEDEPLFASPTTFDRAGRIMAPVTINGRGPFRLLVDTGANITTISTELADELGIDYASATMVTLNGVTGSALAPIVHIEQLQAGALVLKRPRVIIVAPEMMAGSDGILGVAGLKDKQLSVDFKRDRVTITHSRKTLGGMRIRAQRVAGGLLVTKINIGRVRALAVIDTGAESTLGNRALQQALRDSGRASATVSVLGTTPHVMTGDVAALTTITLGNATISNTRVTFGDFHVFDIWKLQEEPALILGMDVIGTVDAMVIDFRLMEIAIHD